MFRKPTFFKSEPFFSASAAACLGLFFWSTYQAFVRGGKDFSVFYHAWSLVLQRKGDLIYEVSPDRFLYAPSFAYLLSPLGLLPEKTALFIWTVSKICLLLLSLKGFYEMLEKGSQFRIPRWLPLGGILLVARPIMIDIEYGQVNLLILSVCMIALCGHFREDNASIRHFGRWFFLSSLAIAKIFALPLLSIPFIVTHGVSSRKLKFERLGILSAFICSICVPALFLGWQQHWEVLVKWKDALLRRGLPLESHNQSFTAFLYHYFSGVGTEVRSEGPTPIIFGYPWLNSDQISYLSLCWTVFFSVLILIWIAYNRKVATIRWMSVLLGLLIIPSHLIWKPYFVMSLPSAILLILQKWRRQTLFGSALLIFFFSGMNLTGFDTLGHSLGAQFESASILLLLHLFLLSAVLLDPFF